MKENDIIEGNKLIAEFMGWVEDVIKTSSFYKKAINKSEANCQLVFIPEFIENYKLLETEIQEGFGTARNYQSFIEFNDLKFHASWDWLMPVVEKIESIKIPQVAYGFEFSIKGKRCITLSKITGEDVVVIGFHNYDKKYFYTKLEATWLAVVEFIKWYNKSKEVPMK